MHSQNRLSAPPTKRQRPPGHSPLVPHTRFPSEIGCPGDSHTNTPWESPDAKTSSRRFRLRKTARQPFRRCVFPMSLKAIASMRAPEGVSTTWTPHTKTPLPCSDFAGPEGPLLLGPHSHATALLPLEPTGAKPVAQSSRISLTPPTMRGTGHYSGGCSTSRVSLVLRFQGRVASRCYPAGRASYVRFSRSGIVSVRNRVT